MTTIEYAIAAWAASRPPWQQAALKRLAKGHVFAQAEIETIASQLAVGQQPTVTPLNESDLPGAVSAGATVLLRAIRDVTNVNALLDAQELTLAPAGLTVIYGDNGSGKSGYARLIKAVVGARHRAPVHANVFGTSGGQPQKAVVLFSSSGVDRCSEWPDAVSPELRAISFYDEACGDAYIGGDSELTYRPSALVMLDGLITVCDAVSAQLGERLRANQLARGSLPAINPDTAAGRFLVALSGATTVDEVGDASALAVNADEERILLIQEEARLRSTDPTKERTRLETLASKVEAISVHIAALAVDLSDENVTKATTARSNAIQLRAAATVASSDTFETEPVPGVGTSTWRALWDAARSYSEAEAYHERRFPATAGESRCVLCQQELSASAADRLDRFQAFMSDTTAQQAAAAEEHLAVTIRRCHQLRPITPQIAAHLVELEAADSSMAHSVTRWLEAAADRRTSLLARLEEARDAVVPPLGASPYPALHSRVSELRRAASAIDAPQFQAALDRAIAQKNELEARMTLAKHSADVDAEIKRLEERSRLELAKRLTDTTGITRKSTELTEAHVTSLVRDRFIRESDRLKLERIELKKTGGHKGKLRHQPSLLGARAPQPVEEVLSEGEQTALGLAGYFTEAYFDTSRSALVLDDPVTSLDHIRRAHVAGRLAQLATDRQVVVFTHDVAFVGDLRQAADEEQVPFTERGIQRRGGKTPGFLTDQHPWKAKDVGRRLNELEQALAEITRERASWDQDTYEMKCADWAGKLSETWERLINLEIVYTVVDPGTSHVHPNMFRVLARITEADDREFQQSYARISGWARRHDKSPSTNYVAPDPEELESEIAVVKAWFSRIKSYRK